MRTLKEEELKGRAYQNLDDARRHVGEFLEEIYNRQRLHSALRYATAEEFEQSMTIVGSDGASHNPKATDVNLKMLRTRCSYFSEG